MERNRVCRLLDIQYPVIQAPMNWITSIELASAVSNAGGLGTIGMNAGYRTITTDVTETSERLREQIRKIKELTTKPFAVNFAARAGEAFREAMLYSEECVKVAIEEGIPVAILSGTNPELYTKRLKEAGVKVLHRPNPCTVKDARKAEEAGIDAVVAVGYEAGGHSGVYRTPTFVLIPQVVDAVKIPVIAGGGIVDARGFVAALALGAEAVYIGTAFIATHECPAHANFKQAIIDANDTGTVAWTGPLGVTRALRNEVSERCLEMEVKGASPAEIDAVGQSAPRLGMLEGDVVNSILACGAAAGIIKEVKGARELVQSIVEGAAKIFSGLQKG